MAINDILKPVSVFLKRYKYVVLIVALGVVLMTIPQKKKSIELTDNSTDIVEHQAVTTEMKLENILSRISGAGNVSVMLSEKTGEETVFEKNTNNDENKDSVETKIETVIITDQNRSESGLIRQTNPPNYLGAIIVCQGADDPKVRLAITDAVSKITGLGANQISVLKMK